MKKRDFLLIAMVIVASFICCFAFLRGADGISVYKDGGLWGRYRLSENRTIDIDGTNIIVIENGEAYMKSATCPDKLCVLQGKIGEKGGSIVCLPNKVVVESKGKFDAVSR